MKKVCAKCKVEKELFEFSAKDSGKYGCDSRCKVCQAEDYAEKKGLVHYDSGARLLCGPVKPEWKRSQEPSSVTCGKCLTTLKRKRIA